MQPLVTWGAEVQPRGAITAGQVSISSPEIQIEEIGRPTAGTKLSNGSSLPSGRTYCRQQARHQFGCAGVRSGSGGRATLVRTGVRRPKVGDTVVVGIGALAPGPGQSRGLGSAGAVSSARRCC